MAFLIALGILSTYCIFAWLTLLLTVAASQLWPDDEWLSDCADIEMGGIMVVVLWPLFWVINIIYYVIARPAAKIFSGAASLSPEKLGKNLAKKVRK